jgi:hypothetical protein
VISRLSIIALSAISAIASSSSFAGGGALGTLSPSASFSNTVSGGFTDTWTFDVAAPSIVAGSLTNVEITLSNLGFGGIVGLAGYLDAPGNSLSMLAPVVTPIPGGFTTAQVLVGSGVFSAGLHSLVISGTGVTGGSGSYGGNLVATPVPEPRTSMMLLAGVAAMGAVVRRRRVA